MYSVYLNCKLKGDVNMENVLKKGFCLIAIYAFALLLIFLMSDRIMKLDGKDNFRNTNGSVAVIK